MFLRNINKLSNSEVMGEETPSATVPPSEAQAAEAGENQTPSLEAQLAVTQLKLNETHDRMLRIAAEAENTRKRLEKEKKDVRLYSIQEFAKDLLPVIDAFEKSISTIEQTQLNLENEEAKKIAAVIEGVQLVAKVFQDTVKKHGIERLPGKDSVFNPLYHNAITKVVDASLKQETVLDEFMSGYKIGDRILRTAMVRVGSPD